MSQIQCMHMLVTMATYQIEMVHRNSTAVQSNCCYTFSHHPKLNATMKNAMEIKTRQLPIQTLGTIILLLVAAIVKMQRDTRDNGTQRPNDTRIPLYATTQMKITLFMFLAISPVFVIFTRRLITRANKWAWKYARRCMHSIRSFDFMEALTSSAC